MRDEQGNLDGGAAVVLTVNKQPGSDTRKVDEAIKFALADLKGALPGDIRIENVYSQRSFIDRAIDNVVEALADGGVLVLIILFLFLLNFRTTFITLTAIPLSIIATGCVFAAFGLTINTMTLGGIAVAIGELVDDAIVDVENIFSSTFGRIETPIHRAPHYVLYLRRVLRCVVRSSMAPRSSSWSSFRCWHSKEWKANYSSRWRWVTSFRWSHRLPSR